MTAPRILTETRGLTVDEWLAWRRQGLGASDAAVVLGEDPWRTPWQLYLDKQGELPDDDANEAMYWGQVLEDVVAREYARRTESTVWARHAIFQHDQHEWMLCNPDRYIGGAAAPDGHQGPGYLEVKTSSPWKADEWADGEAPLGYLLQWQHAAAVLDVTWGALVCLLGGQRLVIRPQVRDDELVAHLIDAEQRFWTHHVVPAVPPPVDGAESTEELLKRLYDEADPDAQVVLDGEAADAAARYDDAKNKESAAEARKKQAGNELRAALGVAEVGWLPDQQEGDKPAVTWKTTTRRKFEEKQHKAEQPDCHDKYTTTTTQRRLNVRPPKEA